MKKNNKYQKIILLTMLVTILLMPTITQAATEYTTKYIVCGADQHKFPYVIADLMSKLMLVIKIAVPLLLVISGTTSFLKVVSSGSADDDMKKAQKKLINNIIAAVVIFLVISLVNVVVKFVAGINNQVMPCINCFINPKDCTVIEETEDLRPECIQNCDSFTNKNTNTDTNTNSSENNNPTANNNTNTETNNNTEDTSQNNNTPSNNNTNSNNNLVFPDGYVVYFNPVTATKCDEQEYNNNSDKLGNSGCLKWYTFNDESRNDTVNMILDHTISKTEWINSDDYKNLSLSKELGVSHSVSDEEIQKQGEFYIDTRRGPLTLLKKLKEDTSNWSTKLLRNDKYKFQFMKDNYDWYEINYTNYKARLMSAEEAFKIVQPANNGIYAKDKNSTFDWLFIETDFWPSTSTHDKGNPYYIYIDGNGQLITPGVLYHEEKGLRPVITVSKIDIRI